MKMKSGTTKTGKFKSKGSEILGRGPPSSVESFLKDSADSSEAHPPSPKPENPQIHSSTIVESEIPSRLGRLHIEIRMDLVQQLLNLVFQRKCDPVLKRRATQRAVIEEALEEYFIKNSR